MESLPQNPLLEFKPDTLNTLRKQYNLEKPGDMDKAIDILDAWIKQQNHFVKKDFPRSYLEVTIISNKGSIEKSKVKLDKICTYRTLMPDMFRDALLTDRLEEIDDIYSALLPKQTDEHYRVYIVKNIGQSFTSTEVNNYFKYFILICEYMMANDYSNGFILLVDCTETHLTNFLKALNLMQLRQALTIITEGYSMRLRGIHYLTTSKAIDAIIAVLKQVLSAKIGSRIFVHKDVNSLSEYIPQEILPSEYGGKEKSILELRKDLMDTLTSKDFVDYVAEMNEAKTDETLRQSDKFNDAYMGTPGTFRAFTTD